MSDYLRLAEEKKIYEFADTLEEQIIRDTARLVEIPSLPEYITEDGMPYGPEISRCLDEALAMSEKMGFRTHNEEGKYGWAETGEGDKLLCIFMHLDVVKVGDGWTREPFKLTREGDMLYGRGVLDDKAPTICILHALKTCCDLGVKWPCRVRVWFGTNEESGKVDIQMYLKKYGVPDYSFIPDSQFPLSYSELSGTGFELRKVFHPEKEQGKYRLVSFENKIHPNIVAVHASCSVQTGSEAEAAELVSEAERYAAENGFRFTAESSGSEVHIASEGKMAERWNEPWTGVNGLAQLAMFLAELDLGENVNSVMRFVAGKIGTDTDGKKLGVDYVSETASLSMTVKSVRYDDFGLGFGLYFIFPAELKDENLYLTMLRYARKNGFEIIAQTMAAGFVRDRNMPLLKVLYKSYCEVTGKNDPIKVCGGTYAKFVPNSIPFGVIFGPEQDICHSPDEHIRVKSELMVWVKIYINALLRFADSFEEL